MLPKTTQAFFPPLKHMFSSDHLPSLGFSSIAAFQVPSICVWMSPHDSQVKLHHGFQVVCPVPQYPLYLSPWCTALAFRTVISRPWCSSYLCFRSLTIAICFLLEPFGFGQLFPLESPYCLEPTQLLTTPWKFGFPSYSSQHVLDTLRQDPGGQEELLIISHLSIHSSSEDAKQGTCIYLGLMCKDFPLHSTRA